MSKPCNMSTLCPKCDQTNLISQKVCPKFLKVFEFLTCGKVNKRHVRTLRIYPKYVQNVSKFWTHFGHFIFYFQIAGKPEMDGQTAQKRHVAKPTDGQGEGGGQKS